MIEPLGCRSIDEVLHASGGRNSVLAAGVRRWYVQHEDHLPPTCKERSLTAWIGKAAGATRNASPRIAEACPREIEHMLPPPPPDCANVLIGDHIVLFNRKTSIVVDIFHFEI